MWVLGTQGHADWQICRKAGPGIQGHDGLVDMAVREQIVHGTKDPETYNNETKTNLGELKAKGN